MIKGLKKPILRLFEIFGGAVLFAVLAVGTSIGFMSVVTPIVAYAEEYEPVTPDNIPPESPIYQYLYEKIMAKETHIDMSKFNIMLGKDPVGSDFAAGEVYSVIDYQYMDAFQAGPYETELELKDGIYYLKTLIITYKDYPYDMDAFYAARDEALSLLSPEMTQVQKALALHEYLVGQADYDYYGYSTSDAGGTSNYGFNSFNAYGALVDHLTVCDGFAKAYKYLCNEAGLECYYTDSRDTTHAWNTIVLDGEAYDVDLTCDNPCYDLPGRVWHYATFCSEACLADHYLTHAGDRRVHYYGKLLDLPATSTKYEDAFWREVKAPVFYYKGNYYYSVQVYVVNSRVRAAIATRPADGTGEEVLLKKIFVPKRFDPDGIPWYEGYVIKIVDDRIYFNTMETISSMTLTGDDFRDEYVIDTGDKYMWGAVEIGGQLYTHVGTDWPMEQPVYYAISEDERVYFPEVISVEEETKEDVSENTTIENVISDPVVSKGDDSGNVEVEKPAQKDSALDGSKKIIVISAASLAVLAIVVILVIKKKGKKD